MKILFFTILSFPLLGQVQFPANGFYTMNAAMSLDNSVQFGSIYGNMAGLQRLTGSAVSAGLSLYPGLPGIYSARASWVYGRGPWVFGLSAVRTGSRFFNLQALSVSSSTRIGITAIGLRINWHQLFFSEVATYHLPGIDLGAISELTGNIQTGVFIARLNRPAIRGEYRENLPLLLSTALRYKLNAKIGWYGEITATEGIPLFFRTALEYLPDDRFSFRLGTGNGPLRITAGMTWSAGSTSLNYLFSSLPFPGSVQSWDLGFTY